MEPWAESAGAHALRVGAIAGELGAAMGLDHAAQRRLRLAALHHEGAPELLTGSPMARLTADVIGEAIAAGAPTSLDSQAYAIVRALQDPRWTTEATAREVEFLQIADALDQELEFEPYNEDGFLESGSPYVAAGLAQLRCVSREQLRGALPRLPVFPSASLRAVCALAQPDTDRDTVERVATSDPVLAGTLVSAANCAIYSPRQEIRSVPRAVSHIGCNSARAILLAAIVRPVFAIPILRRHWKHALDAADVARQLAIQTGRNDPDEAVLAGLVHDIGVVAVSLISPAATARCERLVGNGCPLVAAEWLACEFDHSEASATVLEAWQFPRSIVDAVRFHHAPERSDSTLASLLYLAEFCTGSDEDIPSTARLKRASADVGATTGAVIGMRAAGALSAVFA